MTYKINELKPILEPSLEKIDFAVCDIEAADWIKFLTIGYYDGKEFKHFEDIGLFLDHAFKKGIPTVFAHFGGKYDFQFLEDFVIGYSRKYHLGEMIPMGSGRLCIEIFNNKGSKITFRDSSYLLNFSLKRITENFGVAHVKQEIDYTRIKKVTPKLIKYLEFDCKGLFESLEKFYLWDLIREAGPRFTIASQALLIFRTFLTKPIPGLPKYHDRFIRRAYVGGRVEIFRPLFSGKGETLYHYDVNSLYPTVMRETPMPGHCLGKVSRFVPGAIGFYEAIATVPKSIHIPPLPTRLKKGNKLIFPTGTFRGVWSNLQLEYAESLGCTFKIKRGIVFEYLGLIFEEYIDTFSKIKEKAKKNSVDYELAKLLQNSLYGRFSLRQDRETLRFDDGKSGGRFFRQVSVNNRSAYIMKEAIELHSYTHIGIGATITAAAQVHMHKHYYSKCKPSEIFYTDTDSLFTTKFFETGSRLGALKLEYSGQDESCFLLPKTYIISGKEKKIVMKGFDKKKIRDFELQDFKLALAGDLKHLKIVTPPRFAKFKTAVMAGKMLTMTKESTKSIKSVYDKRIIYKENEDYFTRPIHLKMRSQLNGNKVQKKKEIRTGNTFSIGGKEYRRKARGTPKNHNSEAP